MSISSYARRVAQGAVAPFSIRSFSCGEPKPPCSRIKSLTVHAELQESWGRKLRDQFHICLNLARIDDLNGKNPNEDKRCVLLAHGPQFRMRMDVSINLEDVFGTSVIPVLDFRKFIVVSQQAEGMKPYEEEWLMACKFL